MKTKDEVIDGYLSRHTPEGQVIRSELDGIWRNGYEAGLRYNEKKLDIETTRQYNMGYANGVEAGRNMVVTYEGAYDKGADDGRYELWWAIKKLYLNPDEGGLSAMDVVELFGEHHIFSDILRNYTPEEVIEKVKSYEESKKSAPTNRDKFEELLGYKLLGKDLSFVDEDGEIHRLDLDESYKEPSDGN